MNTRILMLATLLAAGLAQAQDSARETIVPPTSEWKWLHPTNGESPAAAEPDFNKKFMLPAYDDSKWQTGSDSDMDGGGFGYGDPVSVDWGTPEKPEHRKTGYLRLKFKTTSALRDLVLSLQRDDGVIVYLDGKEVARDNIGDGADTWELMANKTVSGEAEKQPVELKLGNARLPAGEHVLAISVHNRDGGSTDLRAAAITLSGTPAK